MKPRDRASSSVLKRALKTLTQSRSTATQRNPAPPSPCRWRRRVHWPDVRTPQTEAGSGPAPSPVPNPPPLTPRQPQPPDFSFSTDNLSQGEGVCRLVDAEGPLSGASCQEHPTLPTTTSSKPRDKRIDGKRGVSYEYIPPSRDCTLSLS